MEGLGQVLNCLGVPAAACTAASDVTVLALDRSAVVHMVRPAYAATFTDYVPIHLVPFLRSQLTPSVKRVDDVWDVYLEKSLRMQTQLRRGAGPRTRIGQDGSTPIRKRDWQKYISNTENKNEFFLFCSPKLLKTTLDDILLITTKSEAVLSNQPSADISDLQLCNHTEADSHIIIHLAHAPSQGH